MVDPNSTQTLNDLSRWISIARDAGFVISIIALGWKGRSWIQPVIDFFKRVDTHMTSVESGLGSLNERMERAIGNHLNHIEIDIAKMAGREMNKPEKK